MSIEEQNKELFKQALIEGVNRRIDKDIEAEKQIEEMAKVICPCIYDFNDCESCDLYDNKRCLPFNIAKELYNEGWRKQPADVKAIFEDINEALMAESYKAFHHEYNRIEEAKRQGARAALNNVVSIIGQIEKKYTEREGTDNGTTDK